MAVERQQGGTSLIDVLDRVLDKGLVVAGDIRVSLAEVELLTIRIRLLVCSIDKAEQIGLNWWREDPNLSVGARQAVAENEALRQQIRLLQEKVAALEVQAARPRRGHQGRFVVPARRAGDERRRLAQRARAQPGGAALGRLD